MLDKKTENIFQTPQGTVHSTTKYVKRMHESFILECFGQLAELHLHCFFVKHPITGVTPS